MRVLAGGGAAKPATVWIPSPNFSDRAHGASDIDTIVLHHTASGGTAQDVAHYFQNPSSQVSSHYIVGKDGVIVQSVPDGKKAWHAGTSTFKGRDNVNDFSMGIEIVNRGDSKDPWPEKQYEAVADLVAYLMKTYNVPMERITGHRDVALPKGRKIDPADNFDWGHVKQLINQRMNGTNPVPRPDPKPEPEPQPKPLPSPQPKPGGGEYKVREGDSLSRIAKNELGDMNRWGEIFELNRDRIKNPNLIYPGQILRMPGAAAEPAPKPAPQPAPLPAPRPTPQPAPLPAPQPTPIPAPGGNRPWPGQPGPTPRPTPPPVTGGSDDSLGWGIRAAGPLLKGFQNIGNAVHLSDGVAGGYMRGIGRIGFSEFGHLLKANFVTATITSGFSNLLDLVRGKVTPKQALVGFGTDTVAYTGIGAAATAIGGAVGSIVPGLGTIVGLGVGTVVGFGLSWMYEKFLRPKATATVAQALGV